MRLMMMMFCVLLGLSACVTTAQDQAALRGGMVGATAGAVIGADTGHAAQGAVVGGAIGAAAGVLLQQHNQQVRSHSVAQPRQYQQAEQRTRVRRVEHDDEYED